MPEDNLDFNLTKLARDDIEIPDRPELSVEDARHKQMMDKIAG